MTNADVVGVAIKGFLVIDGVGAAEWIVVSAGDRILVAVFVFVSIASASEADVTLRTFACCCCFFSFAFVALRMSAVVLVRPDFLKIKKKED